jgi:hypothetical protein
VLGLALAGGAVWAAAVPLAGVLRGSCPVWIAGALGAAAVVVVAVPVDAVIWGGVDVDLVLPPHAATLSTSTSTLTAAAEQRPLEVGAGGQHPDRRLESGMPQTIRRARAVALVGLHPWVDTGSTVQPAGSVHDRGMSIFRRC